VRAVDSALSVRSCFKLIREACAAHSDAKESHALKVGAAAANQGGNLADYAANHRKKHETKWAIAPPDIKVRRSQLSEILWFVCTYA
jgi:hypothetical protein